LPEFSHETGYTVIKHKDARRILTTTERLILAAINEKVQAHRVHAGKNDLECLVIESDWPEYRIAREAVTARVQNPE